MFYVLEQTVEYLMVGFLLLKDWRMNDTYLGSNVGSPGGLTSPPNFLAKSITSVAVPGQSKCKSSLSVDGISQMVQSTHSSL